MSSHGHFACTVDEKEECHRESRVRQISHEHWDAKAHEYLNTQEGAINGSIGVFFEEE